MASLKYRREIDGLRAIAVVSVVLYHADPRLLPGGFIGVDVFFVISGYLITALLADEWHRTGRIDFLAFYARRVRRLLPALVALVVAVVGLALLFMGRHGAIFQQTGESAVSALLLVSNLYFQANTGGYFDNPAEVPPMLHLWSLSVEEQYYLVYPALLALMLRWVPGGVGRRLVVLSLVSLLLAEYWVHILPQLAFYQMPARFWELAVGGIVALSSAAPAHRHAARWYLPVGTGVILAACIWTPNWPSFPGVGAVPAVLGSTLVLLGVHLKQTSGRVAALLRSNGFVFVGLISYSLYLWHWPLLAMDANVQFDESSLAWRLSLCVLAVVLAWLSWRYVEQPFRRPGRLGPGGTVLGGLGATILAIAAVMAMMAVDRIPPEARRMADIARGDHPAYMTKCNFDSQDEFTGLKPAECRSLPAVEPTIALWGDSHAMAWQPFVWRLAEHSGQSATGITMNSCRPSGIQRPKATRGSGKNCDAMNERAMEWFESGRVNTLVIAMRWPLVASNKDAVPAALEEQFDGLDAALGRLRHVPRVVIMGPLPLLKRPAPTCLSVGWEEKCAVTRQHHDEVTSGAWRVLAALAEAYPNVDVVDPTDFFCNDATCPVARDSYALYWDSNHVSATASREFAGQYLQSPARYTRILNSTLSKPPQESP